MYYIIDERYVMLMTLLPLILINFIRNLKFLVPLAATATCITVVSIGIIYYYIFTKGITFEDREPLGEVQNFPLFFGTVLFALESVGMVMPIYHEMKTKSKFASLCGVLDIGMTIVAMMYIFMGLFGYLAYGKNVGGSISYSIDENEIPAQVCKIMLAFAIFVSYSLFMYVAIEIIWTQNLKKRFENNKHEVIWEYVIRIVVVCLTFSLAITIPYLDLFISLVGALNISMLGVAFPAIFDSSLQWYHLKGFKKVFVLTKNFLIFLLALFAFVIGTVTSLKEIVAKFTSNNSTIQ